MLKPTWRCGRWSLHAWLQLLRAVSRICLLLPKHCIVSDRPVFTKSINTCINPGYTVCRRCINMNDSWLIAVIHPWLHTDLKLSDYSTSLMQGHQKTHMLKLLYIAANRCYQSFKCLRYERKTDVKIKWLLHKIVWFLWWFIVVSKIYCTTA